MCGQEYRIIVSVVRAIHHSDTFSGYADLYERATEISSARAGRLTCAEGQTLHKRILTHGWFKHDGTNLVRAFLTTAIECLNEGDGARQGEAAPTREELAVPGGMTPANVPLAPFQAKQRMQEMYTDSDIRGRSDETDIFMLSYGEYVETSDRINYAPFVERAERLASFHLPWLNRSALRIVRREWFCATRPDIAVVHVYVQ